MKTIKRIVVLFLFFFAIFCSFNFAAMKYITAGDTTFVCTVTDDGQYGTCIVPLFGAAHHRVSISDVVELIDKTGCGWIQCDRPDCIYVDKPGEYDFHGVWVWGQNSAFFSYENLKDVVIKNVIVEGYHGFLMMGGCEHCKFENVRVVPLLADDLYCVYTFAGRFCMVQQGVESSAMYFKYLKDSYFKNIEIQGNLEAINMYGNGNWFNPYYDYNFGEFAYGLYVYGDAINNIFENFVVQDSAAPIVIGNAVGNEFRCVAACRDPFSGSSYDYLRYQYPDIYFGGGFDNYIGGKTPDEFSVFDTISSAAEATSEIKKMNCLGPHHVAPLTACRSCKRERYIYDLVGETGYPGGTHRVLLGQRVIDVYPNCSKKISYRCFDSRAVINENAVGSGVEPIFANASVHRDYCVSSTVARVFDTSQIPVHHHWRERLDLCNDLVDGCDVYYTQYVVSYKDIDCKATYGSDFVCYNGACINQSAFDECKTPNEQPYHNARLECDNDHMFGLSEPAGLSSNAFYFYYCEHNPYSIGFGCPFSIWRFDSDNSFVASLLGLVEYPCHSAEPFSFSQPFSCYTPSYRINQVWQINRSRFVSIPNYPHFYLGKPDLPMQCMDWDSQFFGGDLAKEWPAEPYSFISDDLNLLNNTQIFPTTWPFLLNFSCYYNDNEYFLGYRRKDGNSIAVCTAQPSDLFYFNEQKADEGDNEKEFFAKLGWKSLTQCAVGEEIVNDSTSAWCDYSGDFKKTDAFVRHCNQSEHGYPLCGYVGEIAFDPASKPNDLKVLICGLDSYGCRIWKEYDGAVSEGVVENTICSFKGERICSGRTVLYCDDKDGDGKLEWYAEPCPPPLECIDGECICTKCCVDECPINAMKCDGGVAWRCAYGSDGCTHWKPLPSCSLGDIKCTADEICTCIDIGGCTYWNCTNVRNCVPGERWCDGNNVFECIFSDECNATYARLVEQCADCCVDGYCELHECSWGEHTPCVNNTMDVCNVVDQYGCYHWNTTSCCVDECQPYQGYPKCSNSCEVERCEDVDGDGCYELITEDCCALSSPFGTMHCEDGGCAGCISSCSQPGEVEQINTTHCIKCGDWDRDLCYEWSSPFVCNSSCSDTCECGKTGCYDAHTIKQCVIGDDGCCHLNLIPCGEGEICLNGECVCQDECVEGKTRCLSGNKCIMQKCERVGRCTQWVNYPCGPCERCQNGECKNMCSVVVSPIPIPMQYMKKGTNLTLTARLDIKSMSNEPMFLGALISSIYVNTSCENLSAFLIGMDDESFSPVHVWSGHKFVKASNSTLLHLLISANEDIAPGIWWVYLTGEYTCKCNETRCGVGG